MNFYIHSRLSVVDFANKYKDSSIAIISIIEPKDEPINFIHTTISEDKILRLEFHDIDKPLGKYTTFNKQHARDILEFVEKQIGLVDFFIVHCHAGISRSAGVAAALSKIYNGNDDYIFNCGKYIPNKLVYNTILNEYYKGD